jgi:alanine racemase
LGKLGHRSIAHLTLPGYKNSADANPFLHAYRRYRGYQKAMAELGLPEWVATLTEEESTTAQAFDGMVRIATQLATLPNAPTAMVVYSDLLAAAALAGVRAGGKRVPEDVSIVGIDKSPLTGAVRPSPAMVAFPHEQMGAVGTEMLLKMMDGQRVESMVLKSTVELAQTVGRPPTRNGSRRRHVMH